MDGFGRSVAETTNSLNNMEIYNTKHQRANSFRRHMISELEHDFRPRSATAPTRNTLQKPQLIHCHSHRQTFGHNSEAGDLYTVRTFEMNRKGVIITKSDSMRSRSTNSVTSGDADFMRLSHSSRASSSSHGSDVMEGDIISRSGVSRVLVTGAMAVGKTALAQQFETSEYLGGFDTSTGKMFMFCVRINIHCIM